MDYYIQGDAAKAEQIKAAFEKLGYKTRKFDFRVGVFYTYGKELHYAISDDIANIIKTHPDYKELELPVEPLFKVGDKVRWADRKSKTHNEVMKIAKLIDDEQLYMVEKENGISYISYTSQDDYELAPKPHYDIANFYAGMPVLVRDRDNHEWNYVLFSHCTKYDDCRFGAGSTIWHQCIPFNEETKHLLGTTDMPSEEYINW